VKVVDVSISKDSERRQALFRNRSKQFNEIEERAAKKLALSPTTKINLADFSTLPGAKALTSKKPSILIQNSGKGVGINHISVSGPLSGLLSDNPAIKKHRRS
jgi:hypothetical protein